MVTIDLDPANDGSDDVALTVPIEVIQSLADPRRELVKSTNNQGQFTIGFGRLGGEAVPFFDLGEAVPQSGNAGLELSALEHPLGVAIDQAANPATQAGHLPIELGDVLRCAATDLATAQPPAVFLGHAAGILQHGPHPLSKDYERLPETDETFIYMAMSHILVKRLARSPHVCSKSLQLSS